MRQIGGQSHDSGSLTQGQAGGAGAWMQVWLIPAMAMLILVVLYSLYMRNSSGTAAGDVVDARTLPVITQTLQVSQVLLPARPASEAEQMKLRQVVEISATLLVIAERAGIVTAAVGLEDERGNRIIAAGNAATKVLTFAEACDELAPGSEIATVLQALARALSRYDIDEVQSANNRLAELRQQLSNAIHATQPGDDAPTSLEFE